MATDGLTRKQRREQRAAHGVDTGPEFHPPVTTGKPGLPLTSPLAAFPTEKGRTYKTPCTSRQLASHCVAKGWLKPWVYVVEDDKWYVWSDTHGWRPELKEAGLLRALQAFGESGFHSPQERRFGGKTKKVMVQDAVKGGQLHLARAVATILPSFTGIPISAADPDRNPALLGLPDCQVHDLNTGRTRPQRPSDYMMRACPVEPAPFEGSVVKDVVEHLFGDRIDEAQRLFGAMLWGGPMGRYILVMPGVTRAGKSTGLKLVELALGPYATAMKSDTLTTRATSGSIGWEVDNANALLRGVRVAVMNEVPRKRRLDPGRVNELTGGDSLLSRRKGGDLVATPSTHSIVFAMNDRPAIDGRSAPAATRALFDRLRPFPLSRQMPASLGADAQRAMRDPLELGAMLDWLLTGATRFRREGEAEMHPSAVAYLEEWWEESMSPGPSDKD